MIEKLNALLNKISHSLDDAPGAEAMQTLRAANIHECGGKLREDEQNERIWLTGVLTTSLGFVHAFEQEVEMFKGDVASMGRVISPHRHKK
jgi:hypothetical protein